VSADVGDVPVEHSELVRGNEAPKMMLIDGRVPYDMAIWGEYFRRAEYFRRHHVRYKAYVEAHGFPCQECRGACGWTEAVLDDGSGPWYDCGFCEGTGYVTRWMRGQWLRWKAEEKRKQARTQAAQAA
jgi:hypothetical protein